MGLKVFDDLKIETLLSSQRRKKSLLAKKKVLLDQLIG